MEKNERPMLQKRRKKSRGHLLPWIMLLAVYVILNILFRRGDNLNTMLVRKGAEEELLNVEGYIFREQTVIEAPTSGFLYSEVHEDQRVKSGEAVMSIYKSEINSQASNELKQIDERINKLLDNVRKAEVFSNDAARIEQEISQLARNIPKLASRNSTNGISVIQDEINALIEKKRIISGEAQPTDNNRELAELRERKARIESENNIERTVVHAPRAGAFTARIDGMEQLLALDALEGVTPSYIKELDAHNIDAKTSVSVSRGDAIGKIVNNYTWSVAAAVSVEDAEEIDEGDLIGIRFTGTGDEAIEGEVSQISAEENGKVVLVVKSSKYVPLVYSTSKAEMELIRNSYKGFKIPADSIRMIDGVKGVYVIRNNTARFIPVNILYSNKEWMIVSEEKPQDSELYLKIYDELIVRGRNLYNGKEVR